MASALNPNPFHWTNCYGDWGYFPESLFSVSSAYKDSGIISKTGYREFQKERAWNVMSYIPVLNVVIGILRLADGLGTTYVNETTRHLKIVRGVCDILLGPLNLIADLVVTVARIRIANSAAYTQGTSTYS